LGLREQAAAGQIVLGYLDEAGFLQCIPIEVHGQKWARST